MVYSTSLKEQSSVKLDANGNGTIKFVVPIKQRWRITYVVTSTNQAAGTTPVPVSNTYLNGTDPLHLEGGTKDGDLDTGIGLIIAEQEDVIYQVFTGGVVGSLGTVCLRGTLEFL